MLDDQIYQHDQVAGNKAPAISCRSERSLRSLPPPDACRMRPVAVDAVWIRKGPTKTWSISRTAPRHLSVTWRCMCLERAGVYTPLTRQSLTKLQDDAVRCCPTNYLGCPFSNSATAAQDTTGRAP